MIETKYICKLDGTYRVISHHVADASDPPAVRTMFARLPPLPLVRAAVSTNERVFRMLPDKAELKARFEEPGAKR